MGERCSFKDEDDCSFVFAYQVNDNNKLAVAVEKKKGRYHFCWRVSCLFVSLSMSLFLCQLICLNFSAN